MTSAGITRALQDIQDMLAELELHHDAWMSRQALRRLESGERRWSDLRLFAEKFRVEWRAELMATLPVAVFARCRQVNPPVGHVMTTRSELIAHVPGEPLSEACHKIFTDANAGWRSPELDESLDWARILITIGADGGMALRNQCWDRSREGWRPSQAVVRAVALHGYREDKQRLEMLVGSWADGDGVTYTSCAVMPGGRVIYEPQTEGKIGQ